MAALKGAYRHVNKILWDTIIECSTQTLLSVQKNSIRKKSNENQNSTKYANLTQN